MNLINYSYEEVKSIFIKQLSNELNISEDVSELIANMFLVHDEHYGWSNDISYFTITNYSKLLSMVKEYKIINKTFDMKIVESIYEEFGYISKSFRSSWGIVENIHPSCTQVFWHD